MFDIVVANTRVGGTNIIMCKYEGVMGRDEGVLRGFFSGLSLYCHWFTCVYYAIQFYLQWVFGHHGARVAAGDNNLIWTCTKKDLGHHCVWWVASLCPCFEKRINGPQMGRRYRRAHSETVSTCGRSRIRQWYVWSISVPLGAWGPTLGGPPCAPQWRG